MAKAKKEKVSVSIERRHWELVKKLAEDQERTHSQIVDFALRDYFEKQEAKKTQKHKGEGEAA